MDLSPKQSFVTVNGMNFCVEERGNPDGPAIVLVMGLACQMTHWPVSLLEQLAAMGYRVIRFDNRDIGLSDKISTGFRVDTRLAYVSHKFGFTPQANYSLHDMADDTALLITALGIEQAHLVGVSMGGMISQLVAAHYPEQVSALTTIMSSTNSPKLPMPELGLMLKLSKSGKTANDMQSVTQRWYRFWKAVESPHYPTPAAEIRTMLEANFQRCYSPGGTIRQMQAILATGSLEKHNKEISAPTLVIHGAKDPLLKPACGKAIAKSIKHAEFQLIPGMGHDLPEQLIPDFVRMISDHNG